MLSKPRWLELLLEGSDLLVCGLFGLLSQLCFFCLGVRLDSVIIKLDDSDKPDQPYLLDNARPLLGVSLSDWRSWKNVNTVLTFLVAH